MKILFLTLSSFSHFPTYKRAVGTGEALAQLGHSVTIACLDCEENRSRMKVEAPHCKVQWFKGGVFPEIKAKLAFVKEWKPDVVYSTSYSFHNLAGLRLFLPSRTKFVIEFCELYSRYPRRRWNWVLWEFVALLENLYVLCASKFLYDHFARVCRRWHLKRELIYSPYAYPDYLRPLASTPGHPKSIVFMAAMYRGYGVFEVLEAFEKVHTMLPDVELELLGGGPDKNAVTEWVKAHQLEQWVHARGFVPEDQLCRYFSDASVFVSPMHDTLQDKARCPSKLFYYLPFNKPIVTCAIGNPHDILGEKGFYYLPLDKESMAEAMRRAVQVSETFAYPEGFIDGHSWMARAKQLQDWLK